MAQTNYYADVDGTLVKYSYTYHPIKDNWLSDCHAQPILDTAEMVFLDIKVKKAWARCRRCGNYVHFSNERFTW